MIREKGPPCEDIIAAAMERLGVLDPRPNSGSWFAPQRLTEKVDQEPNREKVALPLLPRPQ